MGRYSITGRYYRCLVSKIGDHLIVFASVLPASGVLRSESLLLPTSGSVGRVEIPLKKPIRNTDRDVKSVYRKFGMIQNTDRDF